MIAENRYPFTIYDSRPTHAKETVAVVPGREQVAGH